MKKRFKKFSGLNNSEENASSSSNNIDDIFNFDDDRKETMTSSDSKNLNENVKTEKSASEMFMEEGVTQLLGIDENTSTDEIISIIYSHYTRKDEYADDKIMLKKFLETALGFNRMCERFNIKIESCKKNGINTDWFEKQLDDLADKRQDFKKGVDIYNKETIDFINGTLPVLMNAITVSVSNLYEDIESFDDIMDGDKIRHPQMQELISIFKSGHQDNPKLDFSNRNIVNLIANYIEYINIYDLLKDYTTYTDLINEYMDDFKLGGMINDSPFRKHNSDIVTMSKSQIEELFNYCLNIESVYRKKDKMHDKIFKGTEKSKKIIREQLALQGREDEEKEQISKWLLANASLSNTINMKFVKLNKAAGMAYSLIKRLRQANTDRSTVSVQLIEDFEGLLNTFSLSSLKHPKKHESIYVHKIEIQEIIDCLGVASETAPFVSKFIRQQALGEKVKI